MLREEPVHTPVRHATGLRISSQDIENPLPSHFEFMAIGNMLRFIFCLFVASNGLQLVSSRGLSYSKIAGYEPLTSVTDHNALDLDQQEIESHLGLEVPDFMAAFDVYAKGYASKSTAVFVVSNLTFAVPEGARVTGTANDGTIVTGTTTEAVTGVETSLTVEYETSDQQDSHVRCMVGGSSNPVTDGCFKDGESDLQVDGETALYSSVENINGRTIQGFSTNADTRFRPANEDGSPSTTQPYFPDFALFVDYYGSYDYADKWISGAMLGQEAKLLKGNVDFSQISDEARVEAAKKGAAYMSVGMYAIREMEDALDDCERGCGRDDCNDDSVHAWDEAVAFYTGSLEGTDGSGDGLFFYSLADKRCENFKTCGDDGSEASGTSKVNIEVFRLFEEAKKLLLNKQCSAARDIKKKIVQKMWVPLIQGTLRYAWKLQYEPFDDKAEAEGATFLAGVVPMVHACNSADAELLAEQMSFGNNGNVDFLAVKHAFERNYKCMGVSCADVGGLYNDLTGDYEENAHPCGGNSGSGVNTGLAVGLTFGIVALLGCLFIICRRRSKNEVEFKSSETAGSNV